MQVNGEPMSRGQATTLAAFLEAADFVAARVVVERNGAIVPRATYADTPVGDDDVLEILFFVGGG